MMVRAWGTVGNNGLHVTMAIEDPAVYMASAFKEALRSRGFSFQALPSLATRSAMAPATLPTNGRNLCN